MTTKYMAIQHNSDGRPCGWAEGTDLDAVKAEAVRQYDSHECYPGETKGQLCTFRRDPLLAGDSDPYHPVVSCSECEENYIGILKRAGKTAVIADGTVLYQRAGEWLRVMADEIPEDHILDMGYVEQSQVRAIAAAISDEEE